MDQTREAYFCRLCAELQSENHLIKIDSQTSINLNLTSKILHCFRIDITVDDNLPKHICTICCEKVISSYEFHEQVQRAQEILKKKIIDDAEVNNTVCTNEEIDTDDNYEIKIGQSDNDDDEYDEDDDKPLIRIQYEIKEKASKSRKSKEKIVNFEEKKKIQQKSNESDKKLPTKEHVTEECHSTIEPERPFICEKCGQNFKKKGTLLHHTKTHLDEFQFQCQECPKTFKVVSLLRRHLKIHYDATLYKCDVCLREFRHKRALTRHARIHTKELPFECEFCKKCFREKSFLKIHLRQHTGETPYSCTQCNKYFTNDSNFIKHIRGLHRLTNFSIANRRQFPFTD